MTEPTKKDDGGPAFPTHAETVDDGMTLRDWFAGQALAGLLANPASTPGEVADSVIAAAWRAADRMLTERDR